MLYFDYNATAPMWDEAKSVLVEAMEKYWFNPSSPYAASLQCRALLEDARRYFADQLGVDPRRLVFASGSTEGLHFVFRWLNENGISALVSEHEHPAVAKGLSSWPDRVLKMPTDWAGRIECSLLASQLAALGGRALVSIPAANSETGVLQDLGAVLSIAGQHEAYTLCDATQWVGKLPLSELPAMDFMVFSGHKFGGPKGVGVLVVPEDLLTPPRGNGGSQEFGLRPGTENLPAVLAMRKALELSSQDLPSDRSHLERRRQSFEGELKARFEDCSIVCEEVPRLWNTTFVVMPEFKSDLWVKQLARKQVLLGTGSACSSRTQGNKRYLQQIGYTEAEAARTLRISAGPNTVREDYDFLLRALEDAYEEIRNEESQRTEAYRSRKGSFC